MRRSCCLIVLLLVAALLGGCGGSTPPAEVSNREPAGAPAVVKALPDFTELLSGLQDKTVARLLRWNNPPTVGTVGFAQTQWYRLWPVESQRGAIVTVQQPVGRDSDLYVLSGPPYNAYPLTQLGSSTRAPELTAPDLIDGNVPDWVALTLQPTHQAAQIAVYGDNSGAPGPIPYSVEVDTWRALTVGGATSPTVSIGPTDSRWYRFRSPGAAMVYPIVAVSAGEVVVTIYDADSSHPGTPGTIGLTTMWWSFKPTSARWQYVRVYGRDTTNTFSIGIMNAPGP